MSDFLTRLAGRALQQTPVLAPLVPAWNSPLDSAEPVLEDDETRLAPAREARTALPGEASPTISPRPELPSTAPARQTVRDTLATPQLPAVRTADTPVDVERVAAREPAAAAIGESASVVAAVVAARAAMVQEAQATQVRERAPAVEELDQGTSLARREVRAALREPRAAQRETRLPPRAREQLDAVHERTSPPAVDAYEEVAERRVEQALAPVEQLATSAPVHESANGIRLASVATRRPRDITAPPGTARRRRDVETVPPTITVSIGRIEVRAAPAPVRAPEPAAEPRTAPPRLTLDDYLAKRSGAAR